MTNRPGNEAGEEILRKITPQVLLNLFDGVKSMHIEASLELVEGTSALRLRKLGSDELEKLNAIILVLEETEKLEGYDDLHYLKGVDLDNEGEVIPGKEQITFWVTPSQ